MPVARGVPSRLPARPPHFPRFVISRSPFGAEALDHRVRVLSFDPDLAVFQEPVSAWPKTLPGPAELPRNAAGFVCVWVSRGCRATCTSPTATGGKPGEEADQKSKEISPSGFVCPGRAPGTRIAEGSAAGVTATPPPRLGGRGPRVGPQPLRARVAAQIFRAARTWAPHNVALRAESRTAGARAAPGTKRPVRPTERARVRGQRAPSAPRFCLASWLNFPRRD